MWINIKFIEFVIRIEKFIGINFLLFTKRECAHICINKLLRLFLFSNSNETSLKHDLESFPHMNLFIQ